MECYKTPWFTSISYTFSRDFVVNFDILSDTDCYKNEGFLLSDQKIFWEILQENNIQSPQFFHETERKIIFISFTARFKTLLKCLGDTHKFIKLKSIITKKIYFSFSEWEVREIVR